MLVKDCMTRHPIMVSPSTPAAEAQRIMTNNRIRHLPVVGDGKRLVGLVTRMTLAIDPAILGSLDVWEISRKLSDLTVESIMLPAARVATITPEKTIERAAQYLSEHKVGCLPVVEEGEVVVGILSEVDVLHAFQQMLGLPTPGIRVTMRMPNKSGEFGKLTAVLGEQTWCVMGIGTFPTPRYDGYYDTVVKISGITEEEARDVLSNVPDQKIVDIRDAV
jgi:acetoin utilization protein AcuB